MKNLSLLMMTGLLSTQALATTWNNANDPSKFANDFEYRLSALPLTGTLPAEKMPWSETYWPAVKGSINYRWHAKNPIGFDYTPPTKAEVLLMSRDEIADLSPSEKYDLAMGHYQYPLKKEVDQYADKHAQDWHGICHGWSPAALQYREPKAVDVVNPDGITIPFGSSDVKGLLSFFMAYHAENLNVAQVGVRCRKVEQMLGLPMCKDTNPGAFHVVMANELGTRGEGFVAEIDPGSEIWNQPVYGFEVNSMSSTTPKDGTSAVLVNTTLYYTDELDESEWSPVNGTTKFQGNKLQLSYRLDLDEAGKIIGGEWMTNTFPDFIWKAKNDAAFTGAFAGLSKIYQPAQ